MTRNASVIRVLAALLLTTFSMGASANLNAALNVDLDLLPVESKPSLEEYVDAFPVVVVGAAGEVIRSFEAPSTEGAAILQWTVRSLTVQYILNGQVPGEIDFRYGETPMKPGPIKGIMLNRDIQTGDRLLLFLNHAEGEDPSFVLPVLERQAVTQLGPSPNIDAAASVVTILAAEFQSAFRTQNAQIVMSAAESYWAFTTPYANVTGSVVELRPREFFNDGIMAAVRELSESGDPSLAIPAIRILRVRYSRDATQALIEGVKSGKFSLEHMRASGVDNAVSLMHRASLELMAPHDRKFAPALIELLEKPDLDPSYVKAVMGAVGRQMGDIRAFPAIIDLLDSEDFEVKAQAIRALEALAKKTQLTDAGKLPPDLHREDFENDEKLGASVEKWRAWWETAGRKAFREKVPQ